MTISVSEAAAAAATSSVIRRDLRGAGVRDAQQLDRARAAHGGDGLGKGRQFAQGHRMTRQRQVGRHRKPGIAGTQHRCVRMHSILPAATRPCAKPTVRPALRSLPDDTNSAQARPLVPIDVRDYSVSASSKQEFV